jgi:hypothetical protein
MNTTKTLRVRFFALAAVGLALAGAATSVHAAADTRPVMAPNGWNGKMGPGLGSVKAPYLFIPVGHSTSDKPNDPLYFHTSTGQAAQQLTVRHLGPGPWSIRSPGSDRF